MIRASPGTPKFLGKTKGCTSGGSGGNYYVGGERPVSIRGRPGERSRAPVDNCLGVGLDLRPLGSSFAAKKTLSRSTSVAETPSAVYSFSLGFSARGR